MNKLLSIALVALFALVACKKVDGDETSKKAGEILQGEKTWRMTGYYDDGNDRLVNFTGYSFTFSESGHVRAIRNDEDFSGTWKDTVYRDTTLIDKASLKLQFDGNRNFNNISKNWIVVNKTTKTIHLRYQDFPNGPYDDIFFRVNY